MNLFHKTKEQSKLVAVFDIGSSSVGVSLFYKKPSGTPEIIFANREYISAEEGISVDKFFEYTLKTLRIVASKACLAGLGTPVEIFCVLSSPWYASHTRIIKLEKNTPFIFNEKLADSLIQKEVGIFEEEYSIKKNMKNSLRAIELRNLRTSLNGYQVKNPLNQKAKEVEMSIFVSIAEEAILSRIEDTIKMHFTVPTIKFASFPMSVFTVARDMFVEQDNFLLVDIGGEVTDISMVKKDMILQSVSFPLGLNFINREVAKSLSCNINEAISCISLYKDGHMEDTNKANFEKIISEVRNKWLKDFSHSIGNFSNEIAIPSVIFMTIESKLAHFFADTIKSEQFSQYTYTDSKFKVIFLGVEMLHGIATFKENVERDANLIIESIYINRYLH